MRNVLTVQHLLTGSNWEDNRQWSGEDMRLLANNAEGSLAAPYFFLPQLPAQVWHGHHAAPARGADKAEGRVSCVSMGEYTPAAKAAPPDDAQLTYAGPSLQPQ